MNAMLHPQAFAQAAIAVAVSRSPASSSAGVAWTRTLPMARPQAATISSHPMLLDGRRIAR